MPRAVASAAALLLLATACADPAPDFYVHGTGVVVETGAAFAHRPDLKPRMEAALGAALAYWGGSWTRLAGTRIVLVDGPYLRCGSTDHALGCYDGELSVSSADPGTGTLHCVEQTVLVHEVGHAMIGDPRHEDPRWMDFEAVRAALAGRTGYTAEGEADCDLSVGVWRHPPDAP